MMEVKLHKRFSKDVEAFQLDVDFQLEEKQCLNLYGPSGAGKTSILRLLAGFIKADKGKISFGGSTWHDPSRGLNLKPGKRGVAMVFQDYALFPNMTALQNMRYAMKAPSDETYLEELLEVMELGSFLDQKAPSLSGGQQQRVALARALLSRPQVLLLDEALSALDYERRRNLQGLLKEIIKREGLTCVMASHDLEEIHALADQVLILDKGRQQAMGKASELFAPAQSTDHITLRARILDIQQKQGKSLLRLLLKGEVYSLELPDAGKYKVGEELALSFSSELLLK